MIHTIVTGLAYAQSQGQLPARLRHSDARVLLEVADSCIPLGALLNDYCHDHTPAPEYALEKLNATIKRLEWARKIYQERLEEKQNETR